MDGDPRNEMSKQLYPIIREDRSDDDALLLVLNVVSFPPPPGYTPPIHDAYHVQTGPSRNDNPLPDDESPKGPRSAIIANTASDTGGPGKSANEWTDVVADIVLRVHVLVLLLLMMMMNP